MRRGLVLIGLGFWGEIHRQYPLIQNHGHDKGCQRSLAWGCERLWMPKRRGSVKETGRIAPGGGAFGEEGD